MATKTFSIKMRGDWRHLARKLSPSQLEQSFERQFKKAMMKSLRLTRKEVRKSLKGHDPKNARLTVLLKTGRTPLMDTRDTWRAIKPYRKSAYYGFAGIANNEPMHDIIAKNHDGIVIPVTDKMRRLFSVLAAVSRGDMPVDYLTGRAAELYGLHPGPWYPLSDAKGFIKIPPRPFLATTMKRKDWQREVVAHFAVALSKTLGKGTP